MYQKQIAKVLGCTNVEARLVEGFMRLEYGTLDNLSPQKFKSEAKIGYACVQVDPEAAKELATSYGL